MSNKVATVIAPSDIAIELSGVTKTFEQTEPSGFLRRKSSCLVALEDVSFTIRRGEFVAYAGPNGAGKSTTFKLLCGMLAPQSGYVRALAMDPIRQRIPLMQATGVLFGNRSELWWDHPVENSFRWKKAVWDIPDKTYDHMLRLVCDLLDVDALLKRFARELSLGQRMRANLALMLLHDPTLILLDEPTLGLDVLAKRQMIDFLKRINREAGATILVTSHDMDDLTEMAQRIMLIHHGHIAFDGDYRELMCRSGDKRVIRLTAPGTAPPLPGATLTDAQNGQFCYVYDAANIPASTLMHAIADIPDVQDVETSRVPIETVIAELYRHWSA